MRIDGKKKAISPGSRHGPTKKDGKAGLQRSSTSAKSTVKKYTIVRSTQDVEQLEKLRRNLKDVYGPGRYNTDAEIYRDLPKLYFDAVKTIADQQLANDELTAELVQLKDLKASFCRISDICKPSRRVK